MPFPAGVNGGNPVDVPVGALHLLLPFGIHGLYVDGLIDPAAFTQSLEQMTAVGNNEGTVIAGTASCGHIGMFLDINNPERYGQ